MPAATGPAMVAKLMKLRKDRVAVHVKRQLAPTKSAPRMALAFEVEDDDYSDADIAAAFSCIDFEGRGRINADSLLHVLMCSGELVTREEVDAMIRLAGAPGSGAVTLPEFHAMARARDVAAAHAARASAVVVPPAVPEEAAGSSRRASSSAPYRDAVTARASALHALLTTFDLRFAQLLRAAGRLKSCASVLVDADAFSQLLSLSGSDSAVVHAAIHAYGDVQVDARHILLSLCALTAASEEQKIDLAFDLYDADASGTLELPELLTLLAANQLQTDTTSLLPRARMLLSQLGMKSDADVHLTRAHLKSIVERFPRAVFPLLPPPTSKQMVPV